MNKEFIPYEQALHLKELGFNEGCFGYYVLTETRDYKNGLEIRNEIELNTLNGYRVNDDESQTTAPLYQQAFRWFREKYGIMYTVDNNIVGNTFHGSYTKINSDYESDYTDDFATYEDAQLASLKKLIEIVKNK
jgi:hypothetical protein